MDIEKELVRRQARLERLVARRMRFGRGNLAWKLRRLRRELPKDVRADLGCVVAARRVAGHPKIARQIDRRATRKAEQRVRLFFNGRRWREMRLTRRLRWLGGVVGNVTLVALLVAGAIAWAG